MLISNIGNNKIVSVQEFEFLRGEVEILKEKMNFLLPTDERNMMKLDERVENKEYSKIYEESNEIIDFIYYGVGVPVHDSIFYNWLIVDVP